MAVVSIGTGSVAAADKKKDVDPSGTWRVEFNFQGRAIKDEYRFEKGLKGVIGGSLDRNERVHKLQDIKVDGDALTFNISHQNNNRSWTAEYKGTIKNDAITGTLSVERNARNFEFDWNPKRSVELEDVIGTWKLAIESENGTFHPSVTISEKDGKPQAKYISDYFKGELNVTSVKIDKNILHWSVKGETNGNAFTMNFKARPYGNRMSGDQSAEFNGQSVNVGKFVAFKEKPKKKADDKTTP